MDCSQRDAGNPAHTKFSINKRSGQNKHVSGDSGYRTREAENGGICQQSFSYSGYYRSSDNGFYECMCVCVHVFVCVGGALGCLVAEWLKHSTANQKVAGSNPTML